jgi:hypothetical protein
VVRLNKPTSTGRDDLGEINYQKMEYKVQCKEQPLKPKSPNTLKSHSHTTRRTKYIRENFSSFPSLLTHNRYTMKHTSETIKGTYLFYKECCRTLQSWGLTTAGCSSSSLKSVSLSHTTLEDRIKKPQDFYIQKPF